MVNSKHDTFCDILLKKEKRKKVGLEGAQHLIPLVYQEYLNELCSCSQFISYLVVLNYFWI